MTRTTSVFAIVAVVLGFILGLAASLVSWWWKARSIRTFIADEIAENLKQLEDDSIAWPTRSNYIWESMRPIAVGMISRKRLRLIARFYYQQAVSYTKRKELDSMPLDAKRQLIDCARKALGAVN